MNSNLQAVVDDIVDQFTVDKTLLRKATDLFNDSMNKGLSTHTAAREYMPMIPTFVTSIPSGKETGTFLAGDLGGTNFRVCSVKLNGDHTFEMKQSKFKVPTTLMENSTGHELFATLAKRVEIFIKENNLEPASELEFLKLGLTFSFPVDQSALNKGSLLRWTKGYNLPDVVGKDIVSLFQYSLDLTGVNVNVVALANDCVGTLLSRAFVNDATKTNGNTVIGCIFGTGTNGAYFEKLDNIPKLKGVKLDPSVDRMAINTEWGSFDNTLQILPNTKYDVIVDKETSNPGYHLFEKRISGMFLGEILRVALVDLFKQGYIFQELYESRGGSLPHRLNEPWLLDSAVLSYMEIDDSTELRMSELILRNELRLPTTYEERLVIQALTRAISKRAAYLSAIPIAAIVERVKDQYKDDGRDFEVGCDGSVVEFYTGFQEKILDALAMIDPLKGDKKKILLKIAKDGSGLGAAICASVA
jgi:hexokinase